MRKALVGGLAAAAALGGGVSAERVDPTWADTMSVFRPSWNGTVSPYGAQLQADYEAAQTKYMKGLEFENEACRAGDISACRGVVKNEYAAARSAEAQWNAYNDRIDLTPARAAIVSSILAAAGVAFSIFRRRTPAEIAADVPPKVDPVAVAAIKADPVVAARVVTAAAEAVVKEEKKLAVGASTQAKVEDTKGAGSWIVNELRARRREKESAGQPTPVPSVPYVDPYQQRVGESINPDTSKPYTMDDVFSW